MQKRPASPFWDPICFVFFICETSPKSHKTTEVHPALFFVFGFFYLAILTVFFIPQSVTPSVWLEAQPSQLLRKNGAFKHFHFRRRGQFLHRPGKVWEEQIFDPSVKLADLAKTRRSKKNLEDLAKNADQGPWMFFFSRQFPAIRPLKEFRWPTGFFFLFFLTSTHRSGQGAHQTSLPTNLIDNFGRLDDHDSYGTGTFPVGAIFPPLWFKFVEKN